MVRVTTAKRKQPCFAASAKVATVLPVSQLGIEQRREKTTLW